MKEDFDKFLKHTILQKEISLVITKNEGEVSHIVNTLVEANFRQATDALDLMKLTKSSPKIFCEVKDVLTKDLYDFIIQYPTGQIEIYDKYNLKSRVIEAPENASILIVITKDALIKSMEQGFDIIKITGLAYQFQ